MNQGAAERRRTAMTKRILAAFAALVFATTLGFAQTDNLSLGDEGGQQSSGNIVLGSDDPPPVQQHQSAPPTQEVPPSQEEELQKKLQAVEAQLTSEQANNANLRNRLSQRQQVVTRWRTVRSRASSSGTRNYAGTQEAKASKEVAEILAKVKASDSKLAQIEKSLKDIKNLVMEARDAARSAEVAAIAAQSAAEETGRKVGVLDGKVTSLTGDVAELGKGQRRVEGKLDQALAWNKGALVMALAALILIITIMVAAVWAVRLYRQHQAAANPDPAPAASPADPAPAAGPPATNPPANPPATT